MGKVNNVSPLLSSLRQLYSEVCYSLDEGTYNWWPMQYRVMLPSMLMRFPEIIPQKWIGFDGMFSHIWLTFLGTLH